MFAVSFRSGVLSTRFSGVSSDGFVRLHRLRNIRNKVKCYEFVPEVERLQVQSCGDYFFFFFSFLFRWKSLSCLDSELKKTTTKTKQKKQTNKETNKKQALHSYCTFFGAVKFGSLDVKLTPQARTSRPGW